MTYGSTLHLPGDFFTPECETKLNEPEFVNQLRTAIQSFVGKTRRHGEQPVYVPAVLKTATHVFVRVNTQKKSLDPPYTGPYKVIEKGDKCFNIMMNGKSEQLSIDRLKPAFVLQDILPTGNAPDFLEAETPKKDTTRPVQKVPFKNVPTYCLF